MQDPEDFDLEEQMGEEFAQEFEVDSSDAHATDHDQFARLGLGRMVYVQEAVAGDVSEELPGVLNLAPDTKIFILHSANGLPLMLSDDRNRILASARENSLEPVSLH